MSLKVCISSSFSANNLLRRKFSSSRALRRLASEEENPLYFFLHLSKVLLEMEYLRQTSAIEELGSSASAKICIILSMGYLVFFIEITSNNIDLNNIKEIKFVFLIFRFLGARSESVADSEEIRVIGELLEEICLKLLRLLGLKEVTIDQDVTFIEVSKKEAKVCYKGYKAYSSLMSFISEVGICIGEETREGNVSASRGLLKQLKKINKKLKKKGLKLSRYRADSASYQSEIINYCFKEGIEFFIGGDLDRAVMEGIENIPEESWKPYVDRYGVKSDREEVSEFIHTMNKTGESFRIVVVREEVKEKVKGLFKSYKYRVISTNSILPANEVVNVYNERGKCEYYIKEAKYGFNLKNLPSGNLESNGLWLKVGMLSYNLMMMLKHRVLEISSKKLRLSNKLSKINYKNKESKSLRYLIFSIAGKLVRRGRSLILKLCCSEEMLELLYRSRLELMRLSL